MSSRKVKTIDTGAIISANDLRSGRTVYLTRDGDWRVELNQALLIRDDAMASEKLQRALTHADVVGAALIKTTEQGEPLHIRELIRALGPSIANNSLFSNQAMGVSNVPV